MAGRQVRNYIRSVFEPLAAAASRPDLLKKLKTADLAEERRETQYAQFASVKLDGSNIVYLPGGGFLAIYSHSGGRYVALSSSSLNSDEEDALSVWAAAAGLEESNLDESTFLFLSHDLKGYFRLNDNYRVANNALNAIDIVTTDYAGHAFEDLYSYYRPVYLFRIPESSFYFASDVFEIGTSLCCDNEPLRSHIIDSDISAVLSDLSNFKSLPQENLFQALTASQWRHVFLELYRCIEALFFLPWIVELKKSIPIQMRAFDLKSSCRASLRWREKEEDSIVSLFEMLAADKYLDAIEDKITVFIELKSLPSFSRGSLGRRIYKVRNGLVHHEDYEEPNKYKLDDAQWRFLSVYLGLALVQLHRKYERDLLPRANAAA